MKLHIVAMMDYMLAHALAPIRPLFPLFLGPACPLRSFRRREAAVFLTRLPLAPPLVWRAHRRSAELSAHASSSIAKNAADDADTGLAPLARRT